MLMLANNVYPDQLASSEASWSGSTLYSVKGKFFLRENHAVCLSGQIWYFVTEHLYSKACVKWPLKYKQNKDSNDKW